MSERELAEWTYSIASVQSGQTASLAGISDTYVSEAGMTMTPLNLERDELADITEINPEHMNTLTGATPTTNLGNINNMNNINNTNNTLTNEIEEIQEEMDEGGDECDSDENLEIEEVIDMTE